MRVLFRVDSGFHIGAGHVMRCLTLAKALSEEGYQCTFLTRPHFGSIIDHIKDFFPCYVLDGALDEQTSIGELDYWGWLGVSNEQESYDLENFLEGFGPLDLVIFDHYAIGGSIEKVVKNSKVFVIDDLMNRDHDCDFLLDQNLSADINKYKNLNLNKTCKYMMGTEYALLRPEFAKLRPSHPPAIEKVNQLLVFFGGSDVTGESRKVVEALQGSKIDITVNVILSKNHQNYPFIKNISELDSRLNLLSFVEDMAQQMSLSDVCFGAAGTSSWERASLGIPSFIVVVADNQIQVASELGHRGAATVVGDGRNTTSKDWDVVLNQLHNIDKLQNLASMAYNICDGLGCQRVVEVLNELNV